MRSRRLGIGAAIGACAIATIGVSASFDRSTPVHAQAAAAQAPAAVDASLLAGLRWRSLGPARGGRSQAVAGSNSRPLEYYFGATGGGLWKTTDGGSTWQPVSDKFFKSSSVGAVAVSESNPDVVYVGHGRDRAARQHHPGRRRLQIDRRRQDLDARRPREDAGDRAHPRSTRPTPTSSTSRRSAIPTARTPSAASSRSTDGGKTLDEGRCSATTRPARSICRWIAKNPDVLYAGLWEVFRTPHSLSSGGPGSGLFKSDRRRRRRGPSSRRTPGCRSRSGARSACRVSGADPNRVYAIVEAAEGGVFLSDDAGTTLEAGERGPPAAPARVLLHAHLRRPAGQGHGLRPQHRHLSIDRRRQDDPRDPRAARRQPRSVDRAERPQADDQQQRRRRQRLGQRRRDLDRPGLPDRAVLQRLHDGARAVPRLRRAAGQQHGLRAEHGRRRRSTRSAAARAATSRPIRRTPTSSTPAATAGC